MASGSFNVSTSNQYISGRVSWSSSTDVNNNQSTVTATLYLSRTNTGYETWGSGTFSLTINGNQKSNTQSYSLTYNSNTVMVSHTVVVPHNADGTKSISIAWGGGISGTFSVNGSSGTATLDTIPRSSTISSFSSFNIGDSMPVAINRASGSFTHTLQLYIGNTFVAEWLNIGTSATLTLTAAQQDILYQAIPNSTNATVTLWCLTYNGSTVIGGWTSVNVTANVPGAIVPTFGTITHSETIALVSSTVGKYVQNLSKLSLAITSPSGAKFSTITSYKIVFDGVTYTSDNVVTVEIKGSGNLTATATVTDSRGRTATKSVTISVLPYSVPLITEFSLSRCNSNGTANEIGTYVKVVGKGSASSLLNSTEKNTLTYTIYSKLRTVTTWTSKKTATITGLVLNIADILGTYDAVTSFDFKIDVKDKFNTTISLNVLPTGQVTMSWGKQGIGIGKVWEQGALDVGGDIITSGKVTASGDIVTSGAFKGIFEGSFNPRLIANSSNLNSYIDEGMYYCPANASAATIVNTPTTQAFSLFVEGHAGIKQTVTEYTTSGSAKMWIRNSYSGSWGPWQEIMTSSSLSGDNKTYGGYKWVNGLLMVWGRIDGLAPAQNTWNYGNFYTSFPNACVVVVGSYYHNGSAMYAVDIEPNSNSQFKFWQPTFVGGTGQINKLWYIAYGY